jgi:hypothetical protein
MIVQDFQLTIIIKILWQLSLPEFVKLDLTDNVADGIEGRFVIWKHILIVSLKGFVVSVRVCHVFSSIQDNLWLLCIKIRQNLFSKL